MKTAEQKIYYCLDIETSGFDPLKEEILEVAFVQFEIRSKKIAVTEKWSKVFKPGKPVSRHVLELTGIKQAELDNGENFSVHKEFLQDRLGSGVIVGHNVIFDIKFLEVAGIKFSGKTVDTLDLAQIFLPTHHSYNLENLAHVLGLPHEDAHRALPDCLATLELLKSSIGLFKKLPAVARQQILALAQNAALPYGDLFGVSGNFKVKLKEPAPAFLKQKKSQALELDPKTIYSVNPLSDWKQTVLAVISGSKGQLLLVLPHRYQVFQLWRSGLAKGVFSPEFRIDAKKVGGFLKQNLSDQTAAKFFMKLAVWQNCNWQSECPLDLNLSFAGGQFLPLLCSFALPESFSERVLCCDHQTFLELEKESCFLGRQTLIFGLEDFENSITLASGHKISWGYLTRLLKNIYDPDSGSGNNGTRETVVKALADTDLFFGLAKGLAYKLNGGFGNLEINEALLNSQEYIKISQAAAHLIEKLKPVNAFLPSGKIENFCQSLAQFFNQQPGRVKWMEMSEWRFAFHNRPLDIFEESSLVLRNFPGASFISLSASDSQRKYFSDRLALEKLAVKNFQNLSSGKFLSRKISCQIHSASEPLSKYEIAGGLAKSLPAAVIVSGQKEVDDFSPALLQESKFLIAAQSRHSGTNRLFNNFTLKKRNLLVASSNLVLKFTDSDQSGKTLEHLGLKALFISFLPFPWPMDPYNRYLIESPEAGEDFLLAKGFYNFFKVLEFFYTKNLKQIIIYLPKNQLMYKEKLILALKEINLSIE